MRQHIRSIEPHQANGYLGDLRDSIRVRKRSIEKYPGLQCRHDGEKQKQTEVPYPDAQKMLLPVSFRSDSHWQQQFGQRKQRARNGDHEKEVNLRPLLDLMQVPERSPDLQVQGEEQRGPGCHN